MCPCLSSEQSADYHTHISKKNTMTSYSSTSQGLAGKTDVMLCDYTGKGWISHRPLQEPGAPLDQQAELLACCREEDVCEPSNLVGPPSAHTIPSTQGHHTAPMWTMGTYSPERSCYAGHLYECPTHDRSNQV